MVKDDDTETAPLSSISTGILHKYIRLRMSVRCTKSTHVGEMYQIQAFFDIVNIQLSLNKRI
jgi:hypothetical protein